MAFTNKANQAIPNIPIEGFRTAKTLIEEFKAVKGSTKASQAEAKKDLHASQTSFFTTLFDGIWQALADNFKTIAKLSPGSAVLINDTKYKASQAIEKESVTIKLDREADNTNMPQLLMLKTDIIKNPKFEKFDETNKSLVNSLQIQDTDDAKPNKAIYWVRPDANSIAFTDTQGNRYTLEGPPKKQAPIAPSKKAKKVEVSPEVAKVLAEKV